MISKIIQKITSLRKDDKGGILVFVALSLLPILLTVGLAVDTSYGLAKKSRLQTACDIAANAGAKAGATDPSTITSKAQNAFNANTSGMSGISGPNVSINSNNNTITVSASILVSNVFMNLGGVPTSTYNATATGKYGKSFAEVAIIIEASARLASGWFQSRICDALIDFVNNLPDNVLVSITPIATEFLLDDSNTASNTLFSLVSPTTNDESAMPGFYPLSSNYPWTSTNYSAVSNPYYGHDSFSVLTSNPSPKMCPGAYQSCSPRMWPLKCPSNKTSCSQVYSYVANPSFPILPLTLNRNLIVNYLQNLKNFQASSDGFFPSLISWGWRTIDPNWKNFWMSNSNATSTLRATGKYPQPYETSKKSIILIFKDTEYWNEFSTNISGYYSNPCGDAKKVVGGVNHWWTNAYGVVPVPTNYISKVDDITCENYSYITVDKALGLNLSDSTNYRGTVSTNSYASSILDEVRDKYFRICNNIKANNVDIYLLANGHISTMAPCCNSSDNAYPIGNSSSSISSALNSVKEKILAKLN